MSGRSIMSTQTVGFALGATRTGPFCENTKITRSYPHSLALLHRWAEEQHPHIPYTAIQVNYGLNMDENPMDFLKAGTSNSR